MASRNKQNGLIPALAYVRMSNSIQEMSIDQQRVEILRYASNNGFRIVRWYTDEAISGDSTSSWFGTKVGSADSIRLSTVFGYSRSWKQGSGWIPSPRVLYRGMTSLVG